MAKSFEIYYKIIFKKYKNFKKSLNTNLKGGEDEESGNWFRDMVL